MKSFPYVTTLLLALTALTGCDHAKHASVPVTIAQPMNQTQPEKQEVITHPITGPSAASKPTPVDNEANRSMIRAAQAPKIKLLPCSTMTGAEYKACVATNAATIRAAVGN